MKQWIALMKGLPRKKLIFIFAGALAILTVTWYYFASYRPMSLATDRVAEELLDPESAKFRNVRIVGNAVCGEVNGKNKLGGYVGYQSFIYFLDSESVGIAEITENLSGYDRYLANNSNNQIHSLCN